MGVARGSRVRPRPAEQIHPCKSLESRADTPLQELLESLNANTAQEFAAVRQSNTKLPRAPEKAHEQVQCIVCVCAKTA